MPEGWFWADTPPATGVPVTAIRGTGIAGITGGTTLSGPAASGSPSYTPASDQLVVVIVSWWTLAASAPNLTISDTLGGLTWTQVGPGGVSIGGTHAFTGALFYAKALGGHTGTPGSIVTVTSDQNAWAAILDVYNVAGVGASPVGQTATSSVVSSTATSLSASFASTPSGLVFASLLGRAGQNGASPTITIPSGYSNINLPLFSDRDSNASTGGGQVSVSAAYKLSGAAASVGWSWSGTTNQDAYQIAALDVAVTTATGEIEAWG